MFYMSAFSQAEFGTALIPGSVSLNIEETTEEYCNNILREKTIEKTQYSTNLTGVVHWDNSVVKMLKKFPGKNGLPGTMLSMNNFTRTLPEGASFFDGKDYQVPRFPVIGNYEKQIYGKDPCKSVRECEPGFETVLNYKEKCSGPASHHGHPGGNFRVSMVGVDKCSRFMFLAFDAQGTFVENGTAETSFINGDSETLKPKFIDNNCSWEWEKNESKNMLSAEINPAEMKVNDPEQGDASWRGNDGDYTRHEKTDEGGGTFYETNEEIHLMKIDTAALFRYVVKKPASTSFSASGSYHMTSNDGYKKMVIHRTYRATLTLGKKSSFTFGPEDGEAFKEWFPGHSDYPGTSKPLGIRAKFDESSSQLDTIRFTLFDCSHLPGICTNYPVLPDNPPKEPSDLYFAPQDQQTDPNIRILDDSTAVTVKKVKEAVVKILSRDFGAHARIRAVSGNWGEVAECTLDGKQTMSVPYDLNDNRIADKWEKDMGVEGADKLEDNDKLPAGQGLTGDGLTVFEEYRGFVCERDLEASCDGGHMVRNGKHVRTSPLCRDVFIYDADGLFERYVAGPNPAECHWHYLSGDQVKLPSPDQVSQVIKAYENDYPPVSDKTPEGNRIRSELDNANSLMKKWAEKEYRRINANSPSDFRNNQQYAMHLLVSPVTSTTGGVTISPDSKSVRSPLRYTHLVVLPQFGVLKTKMMGIMSMLMLNTTHKTLWDKYPVDVQEKVVQTAYEAMVPHEVGHGLGINHHSKGTITVVTSKTKEKFVLNGSNVGTVNIPASKGDCNELFYFDWQEYLTTGYQNAFIAMGVTECCMCYTVEREVDFVEMKVLKPSEKYCRKGQTFIDGNGKKTTADDCFSKILIRCTN